LYYGVAPTLLIRAVRATVERICDAARAQGRHATCATARRRQFNFEGFTSITLA
jgi:hypothetical protein